MYADHRAPDEQAGWYATLQMQSHMLFRDLQQQVATFHNEAKNADKNPRAVQCLKCGTKRHALDVVRFVCHPEKRAQVKYEKDPKAPHHFCQTCLEFLFLQQTKYLRGKLQQEDTSVTSSRMRSDAVGMGTKDSFEVHTERQHAKFLLDLAQHNVRILPCPECKTPNVLTVQSRFHESVERQRPIDPTGTMRGFHNHREATFKLVDNFVVEKVFENQRRPMFGSFSKDNLLIIDWGGHYTDESQAEVLNPISSPPNKAWFWIESFAADTARNGVDRNGWQYASFTWTSKFSGSVSMFDFVRRRRLLHTRIRISEALKEELASIAKMQMEREEEAAAAASISMPSFRRKSIAAARDRDYERFKIGSGSAALFSPRE